MLYVDLSSFKSTVEVSNYRVWLYQSGIRPSATIGLGCVGSSLADPRYNKQANWNPDGSITLIGGAGRENILMQRFSMPIPSGVTFSSTSGTVIQPSTHPTFALTVIFPEERKAMVCCATCTSTPCNPMLELDTAAQCTSKAASKPAGSVKSGDVSHSFAAFQSLPTRIAWNATINSLPTSAVR